MAYGLSHWILSSGQSTFVSVAIATQGHLIPTSFLGERWQMASSGVGLYRKRENVIDVSYLPSPPPPTPCRGLFASSLTETIYAEDSEWCQVHAQ